MAKMISLRSGKQCGGFELGKAKREITKFKREREKKNGGANILNTKPRKYRRRDNSVSPNV